MDKHCIEMHTISIAYIYTILVDRCPPGLPCSAKSHRELATRKEEMEKTVLWDLLT